MEQAAIKDSTEDHQALENALRELHYQKQALDEHAIVSVADANQTIVYANEKFCAISQFTLDELLGGHFCIGIGDEHPDEFFDDMITTILGGEIWHGQLCNRKKDESPYWTDTTIVPFCDEGGTPYKYVIIRTDITTQKQVEMEIRAQSAEIKAAHRELESAQSELLHAEKLASIGQLAAGIAHEINTPTQFVGDNTRFLQDAFGDLMPLLEVYEEMARTVKDGMVSLELLEKAKALSKDADVEYLTEEIPTAIEQALDGVERVANIVRSMKEFSHPGTEGKTRVDINQSIESTTIVSKNEWKYCANMVTEFDKNLPNVPCLPGELNQVFLNIIVNAAHAILAKNGEESAEMGTITISTRHDGDFAEICISDTGSGIPDKIRGKIFDPFFTTKEVGKGTGQGLAVSRSVVVDKHGGTLQVESEMGKGSKFIIRLPITEPETETEPDTDIESDG